MSTRSARASSTKVAVDDTRLFLEGRREELVEHLHGRMAEAAADERFEQAAQLRDAMRTVQTLHEQHQKMANAQLGDRDVFGVKVGPAGAVILVFLVRRGRVVERVELVTESGAAAVGDADAGVLQAALPQFYEMRPVPHEIHLPVAVEDQEAIESWLGSRAGHRVRLHVPQRGDKRGLVDLAIRNATLAYQSRFSEGTTANYVALETLRAVLQLPTLPRRIECFDISTIQGAETVASMVVCEDGRMKRSEYRKFRVRPATATSTSANGEGGTRFLDDFAAMRQVVERRYRRVLEAGGPFPDLIVIDGGKGQLAAAYEALESIGLANLVAVGLAKREELLFVRHQSDPDCAGGRGSGLVAAPADSRRGTSLCGDVPSEGTVDARPAV